jgi:mannose-1-phosphate guanylyltransferase
MRRKPSERCTPHAARYTLPVYAVILVGGKGKRLRPLSIPSRPKPFLSVAKDGRTLFRMAVDRIRALIPPDRIMIVANRRHSGLVKKDFPDISGGNLLLEPVSRNTAPAVTLAAFALKKRPGNAVMAVLPSDHFISGDAAYLECVRAGADFVLRKRGALVTLGLEPRGPSPELGYIKIHGLPAGSTAGAGKNGGIYEVEKFVEKPDRKTAEKYIESGDYLWNTGAFIFTADAILAAVKRFATSIYAALKDPGDDIEGLYEKLPGISLDYAVMEKARNIYCVKGSYRWRDVGGFEALKELLKSESRDFIEKDGRVAEIL